MTRVRHPSGRSEALAVAVVGIVVVAAVVLVWLFLVQDGRDRGVDAGPSNAVSPSQAVRPSTSASSPETQNQSSASPSSTRPATGSALPPEATGSPFPSEAPRSSPPSSSRADVSPGSGSTVPAPPARTRKSLPLAAIASFGNGVDVWLESIRAVRGKARLPGEVTGPAVRLVLRVRNDSARIVPLDDFVAFVSYGRGEVPAVPLTAGTRPFTGSLEPGEDEVGAYVVVMPPGERSAVRVEMSYSGTAPTVVLAGSMR